MSWEFITALVFAVPVILAPVAYVWYLNIGGICAAVRERKRAKAQMACKQGTLPRKSQRPVLSSGFDTVSSLSVS